MNNKLLFLAKRYDLVIGDKFELFYRGFIRSMNPYKYYIHISCPKGKPFPRYFTYTPLEGEEGEYELSVCLYDDYSNLIESAKTILKVIKPARPKRKMNILCFGDSLTFNGVWVHEAYRRFEKDGGEPKGLGFSDSLNFIGTCQKDEVFYEGYGGWQWKHFVNNEAVSTTSSVWVDVSEHNLNENDQHSQWVSNNLNWVLESIEDKKLKFKRGVGNYSCLPKIGETFINVENPEKDYILSNISLNSPIKFLEGKSMSDISKAAFEGTVKAHAEAKVPIAIISIDEINEYNYGYMVYFFEIACATSGYLLKVNPFDQPGVEQYKAYMKENLKK